MAKSDEEKARLRLENEHRNAAKKLEQQRKSELVKSSSESREDCTSDDEEQFDDFNEVWKDLEENGWYKGPNRCT